MPFLSNIERWGIQKGLRRGLRKGRKEGREEGKKEGEQKGLAEGLQEAIAISLEHRFGTPGLELLSQIREIQVAERLRELLRRLQTARSLAAFRAALGKRC
jgi:flagellar biosynthesis/type III secretory pathway protein FliH